MLFRSQHFKYIEYRDVAEKNNDFFLHFKIRLIHILKTVKVPSVKTAPLTIKHTSLVNLEKRDVWDVFFAPYQELAQYSLRSGSLHQSKYNKS